MTRARVLYPGAGAVWLPTGHASTEASAEALSSKKSITKTNKLTWGWAGVRLTRGEGEGEGRGEGGNHLGRGWVRG